MSYNPLKKPVLVINFKTYKESTGKNALKLALLAQKASKKTGKQVMVAVQPTDLCLVSGKVSIPVLAQHVDHEPQGAHTGTITPEAIKQAGAIGTLLNHSEKRLSDNVLSETIRRCKALGLITVCCATNNTRAAKIASYQPHMIAVEPPELIGGKISVSEANPEIISKSVKSVFRVSRIPVLCGAGINKKKDVEDAVNLGAKGVLVASGIVKAKNPYKEILSLLEGLS